MKFRHRVEGTTTRARAGTFKSFLPLYDPISGSGEEGGGVRRQLHGGRSASTKGEVREAYVQERETAKTMRKVLKREKTI